jgi:hypothetical protein
MVVDYYNHILDEMWASKQKENKAKVKVDDGDDDEEVEDGDNDMDDTGKRPEAHMFTGFVAFALMGPYVPEGFESNRLLKLFNRDDEDENDSCSMSKKLKKKYLGRKAA